MRDITKNLRVGTCCGKCLPEARTALESCIAQRDAASVKYFPANGPEFAV